MAQDWTQNTSALKLIVGVLTALLVGALALFVYGIARTAQELAGEPPEPRQGFGDVSFNVPADMRLVSVEADAGRLVLHLERGDGEPQILVLDAATARELGRVTLVPRP